MDIREQKMMEFNVCKTQAKKQYYAVWSITGLGVVDSWNRVLTSRKYMKKLRVRKFRTYKEAYVKAVREYNILRWKNGMKGFKGKLPLNYVLNRTNIRKYNLLR